MPDRCRLRVGIVGHGAVGGPIAFALERGEVAGVELAGVYAHSAVPDRFRVDSLDELVDRSELVVEAASQDVVRDHGGHVLEHDRDLLVVSVGALVDDGLLETLRGTALAHGRRLLVTTGAIGGVDLLRAAAWLGTIDEVHLTTTKPPGTLVQPWMDDVTAEGLRTAQQPVQVFDGPARDAVTKFPRSMNVAATLSLVTVGFDDVRVTIVGDPQAPGVLHRIDVRGAAGCYEFGIRNVPARANPRTSAVTPFAVLRELADLTSPIVIGA